LKKLFSALLLLCICQAQAQKNKTTLKNDLQQMMQWFEGEFDNFQQYYMEKEEKLPNPHEHIHSVFKKINLPLLGDNTFYVIQYMDGDTAKIYRQRLYSFAEDKAENAIRLDIYSFVTDSLYYYTNLHPEKLAGLTMDKLTTTAGCGVYWKKDGEQFTGYMKQKACNFISKRSGKKIFITDSLRLTKDDIWIRDEAYDENGEYVFGNKGKVPHKLKRCKFYKGWILLQKAGFEDEYITSRNLIWHDQGKRKRLYTEDGKKTKYEAELACVIKLNAYGPGKDLEVLKLAVYEDGKDKAIMYTWASPGSKNIGINMRWMQVGLTLQ
jgi:CpeT/CpcT family (DUF1001)